MLLGREAIDATAAVERLAGMQAQVANAAYIGLWSRLEGFDRDDLTRAILDRRVVRATLMRGTLHLFSARDYLALRVALQPGISRAYRGFFGGRIRGLDVGAVVEELRGIFEERRHSHSELRDRVARLHPDHDREMLAYTARFNLPLVQVPPAGTWGSSGSVAYGLAERELGARLEEEPGPREVIRRYLAAFGPASVADMQTWSSIPALRGPVDEMRDELVTFRDEAGRELFDLPHAPRPDGEVPAPVRLLPEFDNLVLSHADRSRVIADEHRSRVLLTGGRVRPTFLVDGFVSGTWKVERAKGTTTVVVEPFGRLSKRDREAVGDEVAALERFLSGDLGSVDVVERR
jgi:hypothetical protein